MLSHSWRLSRPNFIQVLSTGKIIRSLHFSYRKSPNLLHHNRYSIVISKKLLPKAVDRNLLRRRFYSSVRRYPGTTDFIIYPQKSMLKLSYDQIGTLFDSFLSVNS